MWSLKYLLLFLFQLLLMVLYIFFVRYGDITSAKGFENTHAMVFIGFGFLMAHLKRYCYSAIAFNLLLAAITVQWSMFCQNVYHLTDDYKVVISKLNLFEADLMAVVSLITVGALLGVASGEQLIFISIIETVVASFNVHVFVNFLRCVDVGGSIVIHTFGAYFGLACGFAMRFKKSDAAPNEAEEEGPQRVQNDVEFSDSLEGSSYISSIFSFIGFIFLFVYWPNYNAALVASRKEYERTQINTIFALVSATVTTFFFTSFMSGNDGRFVMIHVQNSPLSGAVAIGAVCNMYVSIGGAIAIGVFSSILSVLGFIFLSPRLAKIGIIDTSGVHNIHGMPGIFSSLMSCVFTAVATSEVYADEYASVFPTLVVDNKSGQTQPLRNAKTQALFQFYALLVTLGLSILSGLATGTLAKLKIFRPLKFTDRYKDDVDWEIPA